MPVVTRPVGKMWELARKLVLHDGHGCYFHQFINSPSEGAAAFQSANNTPLYTVICTHACVHKDTKDEKKTSKRNEEYRNLVTVEPTSTDFTPDFILSS